jgi:hypothetical protein
MKFDNYSFQKQKADQKVTGINDAAKPFHYISALNIQ